MIKKKGFLRASTVLFVLNILASVLNYLCQVVMARVLSVESYGTVNTIFSFMMIIAVPGTTLTMIVAKYFAGVSAEGCGDHYLKRQLKVVLLLTIIVFFVLLLLRNLLADILAIHDIIVLGLAFMLASLGYFQPLYSGVFSGKKCFILVGIYSLFIPIYKLVAVGIAYLCSGSDKERLHVLLLVMVLGTIFTAVFGQAKSNHIVGRAEEKERSEEKLYTKDDMNALILNVSIMLYMNMDLLVVRYYGNETESGLYSSVLLFGRIIYYFATTLGTILLPSVAESGMTGQARGKILNRALMAMFTFTLLSMGPINLWKNEFISILYGEEYIVASKYVIYVSIISIALSIYTIMINYVVGIGKTGIATKTMMVVDVALLGSAMLFKNITSILLAIGIIGILGAMVIYISEWRDHSRVQKT